MRKTLTISAIALLAIASAAFGLAPSGAAPRAEAPSSVYLVHGLPLDKSGSTVDVYAGAEGADPSAAGLLADDFTFKTVAGPLSLPPASYTVYVAKPTASDDDKLAADEVIFSKMLAAPFGLNLSAVASFDGAGDPTINVFTNNTSAIPSGGGRISLRHAAAAPAVNVDLGFFPYSRQFSFFVNRYGPATNGQQADVVTAAGRYDIVVRVAESGARVSAVPRFPIAEGKVTVVYAVGIPGTSFGYVVQQLGA